MVGGSPPKLGNVEVIQSSFQCTTCKQLFPSQFILGKHLNQTNHRTYGSTAKANQKKANSLSIITAGTITKEKRTSSKFIKSRLSSYACCASTLNNKNDESKNSVASCSNLRTAKSVMTPSPPLVRFINIDTVERDVHYYYLYFASYSEQDRAKAAHCYLIVDRHHCSRQLQSSVEDGNCNRIMNPAVAGLIIDTNTVLISQYNMNSIQPEFEALIVKDYLKP